MRRYADEMKPAVSEIETERFAVTCSRVLSSAEMDSEPSLQRVIDRVIKHLDMQYNFKLFSYLLGIT